MKKAAAASILCVVMLFAVAVIAQTQQPKKVPRIVYLGIVELPERDGGFRKGLREQGYIEGQNIHVEYRFAEGSGERLTKLAAELVGLKVDAIVASGAQAIEAARRATKTAPIVFPITVDPVESGYVASLARPGGNLTGLTSLNQLLPGKRVELLKEVIPQISRVGVLHNPANPSTTLALKETETAAKGLGIRLRTLEVRSSDDLEAALRSATKEKIGALIMLPDSLLFSLRGRIIDFAIKNRMPEIFGSREHVEAGGLMSYGPDFLDLYRRSAIFVDKILKGAKPTDLPVEQPTKFELIINLKAAKQIGLTIPPNVLARADE